MIPSDIPTFIYVPMNEEDAELLLGTCDNDDNEEDNQGQWGSPKLAFQYSPRSPTRSTTTRTSRNKDRWRNASPESTKNQRGLKLPSRTVSKLCAGIPLPFDFDNEETTQAGQ